MASPARDAITLVLPPDENRALSPTQDKYRGTDLSFPAQEPKNLSVKTEPQVQGGVSSQPGTGQTLEAAGLGNMAPQAKPPTTHVPRGHSRVPTQWDRGTLILT